MRLEIIALLITFLLAACTQAGDSEYPDEGYYYITAPGNMFGWFVEELPQEYPSKQIIVSKEDGTTHTIFSIDGGDVAWICTQETRECREMRRPPMMVPDFIR